MTRVNPVSDLVPVTAPAGSLLPLSRLTGRLQLISDFRELISGRL